MPIDFFKLGQQAAEQLRGSRFSLADEAGRRRASAALHAGPSNSQNPHRYGRRLTPRRGAAIAQGFSLLRRPETKGCSSCLT